MKELKTVQDTYKAVENLIARLNSLRLSNLANELSIRLHGSWTTGTELLEELRTVMVEALHAEGQTPPPAIKREVEGILMEIQQILTLTQRSSTFHVAPKKDLSNRRGVVVEKKNRRR